jgi:pimeloyl-ACP methyl ester carboxylesterase
MTPRVTCAQRSTSSPGNLAGVDIPHSEDDIPRHWHVERLSHYREEGCVILLCERLLTRVRLRHAELGERLALVGWSLGGYLAREVAREAPECLSCVVTLGSPVVGGPKYTLAASFFRERGMNLDWIEHEVAKRDARPIDVPITAIVSGTDGVVHPPAHGRPRQTPASATSRSMRRTSAWCSTRRSGP